MKDNLVDVDGLKVWFQASRGLTSMLFPNRGAYIRAVDGVSFDIKRGEIFCLAGESGCGKTTTAKAMIGLVPITDGEICFDGDEAVFDGQERP